MNNLVICVNKIYVSIKIFIQDVLNVRDLFFSYLEVLHYLISIYPLMPYV